MLRGETQWPTKKLLSIGIRVEDGNQYGNVYRKASFRSSLILTNTCNVAGGSEGQRYRRHSQHWRQLASQWEGNPSNHWAPHAR